MQKQEHVGRTWHTLVPAPPASSLWRDWRAHARCASSLCAHPRGRNL